LEQIPNATIAMKLRSLALLVLFLLASSFRAQNELPPDRTRALQQRMQKHHSGMMVLAGRMAGLKPWEKPRDPFEEMQRRVGMKSANPRSLEYAFHSVSGYGGYVVPVATQADAEGAIYVTGTATRGGEPTGRQFIAKLNPQGDTLWMVLEPGTKFAVEQGTAIALSASGTPIVAGSFWNGSDMDIRLTHYGTDGTTLWQHVYSGEGEGVDMPAALSVDHSGNILVVGSSWTGTGMGFVTLKYDPSGALLWDAVDPGEGGDSWNEASSIAADAGGNVYVTGSSESSSYWSGYYTLKYSSSGVSLWQRRYTQPGQNHFAEDIAVGGEGDVYVTGSMNQGENRFGTIKYSTSGEVQWVRTYRSGTENTDAHSVVLGQDEVIYVGGEHNGESSADGFVLVAYSLTGDSLWVRETSDLIQMSARYLALDGAGNVLIGGIASRLIDPEDFTMLRTALAHRFSPTGEALDTLSHAAVSADTISYFDLAGMDFVADGLTMTISSFYTSQGAKSTTVRYANGVEEPDWVREIHDARGTRSRLLDGFTDRSGNSYTISDHLTFVGGPIIRRTLVKHDANGNIAWREHFDTGIAAVAAHDGSIHVYCVPESSANDEPVTLRVKKLDTDGELLWESEKELVRPAVYSIVVDELGNTFLSGSAALGDPENDAFVAVKFGPDGTESWTAFHAVPEALDHGGGYPAVTNDGGIVLPGSAGTIGWFESDVDFVVTRFNADGTIAWSTQIQVENGSSSALAAVMDEVGMVFATGDVFDQTTQKHDLLTVKLAPNGTVLWSDRYGATEFDERTFSLKRLSSGDVVVAGYQLDESSTVRNTLVRYDQEGSIAWVTLSPESHFYRDMVVDPSDNCYMLNEVYGTPFPSRFLNNLIFPYASVLKVDPNGSIEAEEEVFGPELSEFFTERLLAHPDGRLILAGTLRNENFYEGVHLMGSDLELPTSIPEEINSGGDPMGAAYPNPFKDHTHIPVHLSTTSQVGLSVFDQQGRMVMRIPDRVLPAGPHRIKINAESLVPGQYAYRLFVGDTRTNGKLVVE
jgi:hypothetical protein